MPTLFIPAVILSETYRWLLDHVLLCTFLALTQDPEVQSLLANGLEALSVQETGQLLSYLGLHSLVPDFEENDVSNAPLFCSLGEVCHTAYVSVCRSMALVCEV